VRDVDDIYKEDLEEKEAYDQRKLRQYELQRMKYFYAVVTCDSAKTAETIYNEFNGYEFELSSIKLKMSFVADSLTFP